MSSSSSAKRPPTKLRINTISASKALRTESRIDSRALIELHEHDVEKKINDGPRKVIVITRRCPNTSELRGKRKEDVESLDRSIIMEVEIRTNLNS